MKIISVVGARPNFMKVSPFIHSINAYNHEHQNSIEHLLVHTGQHYDDRMSKSFFKALNIPDADINLGIGSGSHAEQVGLSMIELEKVFIAEKPDWVVVFGDVNATLAASVSAKKLHIKVCHVEAGLRSGDITMPEEVNRLVTDRLSDLLLTPDRLSIENLEAEGASENRIRFVGNIMIDTLEANRVKAEQLSIQSIINHNQINHPITQSPNHFALMTLHRPSNVDHKEVLEPLVNFLVDEIAEKLTIIWAVHPRTQKQLKAFNLWDKVTESKNTYLVHPLDYHSMLKLNMQAKIMLTDSGGLQEECTVLGTPCLTMRWNTERPITLREHGGASVLVGNNIKRIREEFNQTLSKPRKPERPELWDGHTAERCLKAILDYKA
ncbi:MAG: UDP-N-acetylglucosamine 2-epimerase (non-hydrolyzing) [Gudongella sp.]|jgi:UDP-N-acetylglucosamine 2-epimerase (non-hydrolysing)|nr:UDP-N-acetylglucosamine 2-epimerase (non-hydrolyzing) [Bacteroidales bacterium]MDY0237047.1 UDP-N-acetylglucosamine 2-epimerase (non-hydrolyzing) [Gudongella sp.]